MVVRPPKTRRFGLRPPAAMTRCEPRCFFATDASGSGRGIGPAGRTAGLSSASAAGCAAVFWSAAARLASARFGVGREGFTWAASFGAGVSALAFTAGSALIPGSFGLTIISRTLGFLIVESYHRAGWLAHTRAHSFFYSYRTQRPGRHQTMRRFDTPQPHTPGQAKPGTLKGSRHLSVSTPPASARTRATRLRSRDESQSSRGPAS